MRWKHRPCSRCSGFIATTPPLVLAIAATEKKEDMVGRKFGCRPLHLGLHCDHRCLGGDVEVEPSIATDQSLTCHVATGVDHGFWTWGAATMAAVDPRCA